MRDAREEAAAVAREARAVLERERARGRLKFTDRMMPGGAGEAPLLRTPKATAAPRAATPPPALDFAPAGATAGTAAGADSTDLGNLVMPGFETPKRVPLPPPAAFAGAAGATAGASTAGIVTAATDTPLTLNPALPQDLDAIATLVAGCQKCALCRTRTNTVFADGSPKARLVFVGEAPGRDEDLRGLPFVGRAGQLLDKMIAAIEMKREEVYICNVLKCRPPENRTPAPEEVEQCRPYLEQQLALIRPTLICALGLSAVQALLETKATMGSMRGKTFSYRGIPLIPTYHPAALLRNPGLKRDAWADLQRVRDLVRSSGE